VAFGLTMISSSRAATVAFTMPAWAIPLSVWLLGEKLTRAKVLGLALAMAGIAILLAEGFSRIGEVPLGSFLILGASVCWAIGNVLQKRYPVSMPPGAYSAWLMLLGGVPIFLCSPFFEDPRAIATVGLWPALGVAYNVLVAFAFAHWAWFKISTTVPVSVSSLCTPVVPVVGILGGMVLLGERPSGAEYAAMALIIASLLTVVLPPLQRR
jgi:drug/metabolite transporter (DMT)-like permease